MKNKLSFLAIILTMTIHVFGPQMASGFEADTERAYKFMQEGYKHEQRGKYGTAVNSYYHATLMNPDIASPYRCIGRVYVRKKMFKNALDSLQQALYLDKEDPETHYFLGIVYPIVEHNSQKALEHFETYLSLNPQDPEQIKKVKKWITKLKRMGDVTRDEELINTYNSAADLFNKGKYKEAEVLYKKAIEMNPHYAPAREGLGLTSIKLKKFEAALSEFNEAVLINPQSAEAHYGLGIVYPIARDDEDKAIDHFEQYLELAPKAADVPKVKEWIAKLKEKKAAKQDESAFYNKGVEAYDKGDYENARKYYKQAIAKNSNYYQAMQGLGLALIQLKEYEAARASFEDALDLNPDFAESHYGLGMVYPLLGEKDKGITHYWKYLELKPDAPDIKQVLKWIEELEKSSESTT